MREEGRREVIEVRVSGIGLSLVLWWRWLGFRALHCSLWIGEGIEQRFEMKLVQETCELGMGEGKSAEATFKSNL